MTFGIGIVIIESIVCVCVAARIVWLIGRGYRSMMPVFFLFAVISLIVNNFYWITYDLMKPETRMPFAANEIGEAAVYMLLASALSAAVPKDVFSHKKEMAGAFVYAAACCGLWIGWSGEWVQDIIGGIVGFWFIFVVLRTAKITSAFSGAEWAAIITAAAVLIIAQTSIFFMKDPVSKGRQDLFCYILMTAGTAALILKAVLALRKNEDTKKCLALSCFAGAWIESCVYMSEGYWYELMIVAFAVVIILMCIATERQVVNDDIC